MREKNIFDWRTKNGVMPKMKNMEFHPIKALIRIFKYLQIDRCKVIQVYSYLNSSSKLVTNALAGDLKTREILGELF